MKTFQRVLIAAALLLPGVSQAEQFYLGYSHWNYQVSGVYQDNGSNYDLDGSLNASTNSRALYRLRWDTGPGWWPDLAASYSRIAVTGQRTITTGGPGIGGLPVGQASSTANIDANVRDMDATLRYGVPLGWARLSGGVTVKQLKGDVTVSDNAATPPQSRRNVDEVFPMAHAFIEVPLGSRVRIGLGGDWIAARGNEADSILAMVRIKLIGPLDLTGGWQRKRYKVRTDRYLLDAKLQGWQFGGELAF